MRTTRMSKPGLLFSLLALGALGMVACGGGDDDQTTAASETKTTRDELAADKRRARGTPTDWSQFYPADNKSCGYVARYRFAVVEGDVSCREAQGVMRGMVNGGLSPLPGSWSCGGSDSEAACVNAAGETIMGWVTCHNKSPCPGWIKRSVAQRRDRRAKVSADTTLPPKPSPELVQALRRVANDWASLFATDYCNRYVGQPVCERLDCSEIENCTRVSAAFQKSFADATVEDIALKGIAVIGKPVAEPVYRAAVKFSNGEVVVFSAGVPPSVNHPEWGIAPPNRRLYQAAAPLE